MKHSITVQREIVKGQTYMTLREAIRALCPDLVLTKGGVGIGVDFSMRALSHDRQRWVSAKCSWLYGQQVYEIASNDLAALTMLKLALS